MWRNGSDGYRRRETNRRFARREPMLLVRANVQERRAQRLQVGSALAALALLFAGLAWGLRAGARALYRALLVDNPRFTLRTIDARSDGRLTPAQIVEHAGLSGATRLFGVNLRQVWADIEAIPSVKSATVRRRLPDALEVRVMERTPVARVAVPGAGYLDAADREGVLLGPRFASPLLPIIEGAAEFGLKPGRALQSPAARMALAALEICETTRLQPFVRIQGIEIESDGRLRLTLDNGDRAELPDGLTREALTIKLRNLATIQKTILDQRLPRGPDPLTIDLTTEEVFPVRGLLMETMAPPRSRR